MNEFLRRNAPPGQNLAPEKNLFFFGLTAAFLFSLLYLASYSQAYHDLFSYRNAAKTLKPDAMMPPFPEILGLSLSGFWILGLCMLLFAVYHGNYFYQGSKSIFLMKRLPRRWLLARYVLTIPVLGFCVCMAAYGLTRLVYFGIYVWITPDVCLPGDAWQQLWRVL